MKKKYAKKDEDFYKEIELKWDSHDKEYVLTKRHVSDKNSQGHAMRFTKQEIGFIKTMLKRIKI